MAHLRAFYIHPLWNYDRKPPTLRTPEFLGEFSKDEERQFCHDARNRNTFNLEWAPHKEVNYDLNTAYYKVIKKNYDKEEKINNMLRWLLLNRESRKSLSTDFVCSRGVLKYLMCIPYAKKEEWILCATKFQGTIYLCPYLTDKALAREETMTDVYRRMISWGLKFEQFLKEGSNPSEGNNENLEYSVIVKSELNGHSLVYSAEVDGVDSKKYKKLHSNLSAFIEVKTSKKLETEKDFETLHRYKLMNWWSQSYLVGIPTIVCGFRDERGVVHEVEAYSVKELPEKGKDYWKPNVMLNFLENFLTFVKEEVSIDDPEVVYKMERNAGEIMINCIRLDDVENPRYSFLPEWYCSKILEGKNIPPPQKFGK